MNALVEKYIDIDGKGIWLIRALLELALNDTDIKESDCLYVCQDGRPATKSSLSGITEVCLSSLLLGIWHYIVVNKVDNAKGKETYNEWCRPGESLNTRDPFQSGIGDGIKQQITSCPIKTAESGKKEEVDAATKGEIELSAANVDVQATMRAEKQSEPKPLIDLLEDAIDEFDIAEFVDSDYTVDTLRMDLVIAVDSFIATMRYHLRSFRRQQDDVFRNVMSFVNEIEQYSVFLSLKTFCGYGDGRYSKWIWNNASADVEAALKYRININLLYGLISGGGTLSVYGYSAPENVDEAESNEPKVNAEKSTTTNSRSQDNIQIEDGKISREYYNLFVISDEIKNWRFTMPKDRSLRNNSDIVNKFADLTHEAIEQIKTFPSLFMYENTEYGGRTALDQEAYFGFVTDLRVQENGLIKVRFRCVAKINQQQINDIARLLDIHEGSGIMELNQTHWTIKHVDLIEELTEAELLTQ